MSENKRSRKYLLTINNPLDYGLNHENINENMKGFNWSYYCMCDEIGEQGTYHTHLFFYCENPVSFNKVKKIFNTAHIDKCFGTSQENIDYIRKEGKYQNSSKKETNIIETFEEYGNRPLEIIKKNEKICEQVYQMLKEGYSIPQIIEEYPSYMNKMAQLEQTKQMLLEEKYSEEFRKIQVAYIYGETATGKTRYVMDTFGYKNVCKITNYEHPFDNYKGQDVLLLDEFHSSLPLNDLLQYLDGYPCKLPARYADKTACFTKVFIVSNISLNEQYPEVQLKKPNTYNALIRRITKVYEFVTPDDNMPFGNNVIEKPKSDYLR